VTTNQHCRQSRTQGRNRDNEIIHTILQAAAEVQTGGTYSARNGCQDIAKI
jgi:hypothetical protein